MPIKDELLEELLKDYKNLEDLLGKDGLLKELTKRLLEKAMESELTHRLGYVEANTKKSAHLQPDSMIAVETINFPDCNKS